MANTFGTLLFTPAVKELQERYGSRKQYERQYAGDYRSRLTSAEKQFIETRDSFYWATNASNGWPYVQHRGGPAGFLKVLDEQTIAFADFRGNKQYVSSGNLTTDDRVAMILLDYPSQTRLKILGHATIIDPEASPEAFKQASDALRNLGYRSVIERVFQIRVEAFDWNCQQHITQRYTVEQINKAVEPLQKRLQELEQENTELKMKLSMAESR